LCSKEADRRIAASAAAAAVAFASAAAAASSPPSPVVPSLRTGRVEEYSRQQGTFLRSDCDNNDIDIPVVVADFVDFVAAAVIMPRIIVMLWCGVVWCGVVWCGVVWCGVVWCGVVWSVVLLCCLLICCAVVLY
jgi:hypothetical protein